MIRKQFLKLIKKQQTVSTIRKRNVIIQKMKLCSRAAGPAAKPTNKPVVVTLVQTPAAVAPVAFLSVLQANESVLLQI